MRNHPFESACTGRRRLPPECRLRRSIRGRTAAGIARDRPRPERPHRTTTGPLVHLGTDPREVLRSFPPLRPAGSGNLFATGVELPPASGLSWGGGGT